MSRSRRGRRQRLFEIASEMLDFADAKLAQEHGLSVLCGLTSAQVAVQADLVNFCPAGRGEVLSVIDVGWSSDQQRALAVRPYLALGCRADPSASRLMDHANSDQSALLARRSDLTGDRTWYGSSFFNEARSPADIDHLIHSVTPLPMSTGGRTGVDVVSGVTVIRAKGERNFSAGDLELVGLYHTGVWPLWDRHRPRTTEELFSGFSLSPREGETARCLVEGQSPAEIAEALGISRHTCHQYVKSVYKKLRIRNRAQLMARFGRPRRFP